MKTGKLTAPELAVLEVLTEGRRITGPVRLASDLYHRGNTRSFDFGDPVGLVVYLLEGLNERGLVTYREASSAMTDGAPEGYHGLPYDVKLTPKGWARMGYPNIHSEVGRTPQLREVRPSDSTDYRTHHMSAAGGPIEKLPLLEHMGRYPSHVYHYDFQYGEDSIMTRTYTRVTPELEERVVAAFARHGDFAKAAQETNVSIRQARYIVTDRPALKRDTGSLKQRVLQLIKDRGPYADVLALHADTPGPHGLHNLVHIVHSLHKAGLIDFREASGTNGSTYLNIRARIVGPNGEDDQALALLEPKVHVSEPKYPELAEMERIAAAEPVVHTYPELARIIEARSQYQQKEAKAGRYLEAAEILGDSDPETAELLLTKAAAIATARLSPVESEYLDYVESHPDVVNADG